MDVTVSQIIMWVIVGAVAGEVAGLLVRRRKGGYGRFGNLALGLIGAVVGGFLVGALKIHFGLPEIKIKVDELLAALIGAVLFMIVLWVLKKVLARKPPEERRG